MTRPGIVSGPPKPSSPSQRDGGPASGSDGFAATLTNLLQTGQRPTASLHEASQRPTASLHEAGRRSTPSPSQPGRGHDTPQTVASSERAVHAVGRGAQRAASTGTASAADDGAGEDGAADTGDSTTPLAAEEVVVPVDVAPVDVAPVDVAAVDVAAVGAMPAEAVPAGSGTGDAPAPVDVAAVRDALPHAIDVQEPGPVPAAPESAIADATTPDDGVGSPAEASSDAPTPPQPAAGATPAPQVTDNPGEAGAAAPQQPANDQGPAGAQPTPLERPVAASTEHQDVSAAASDAHRAEPRAEAGELLSEAPIPRAPLADDQVVSPQTAVDADAVKQPSAPAQPSALGVDPSIVVEADNQAATASGQGVAATHNASGGSPAPALAPATTRVIELVERLRNEPPPQQLVVDLDQFGVGKLVISLRANKVLVGTLGTAGQPDPQWWQDLGDALDARGWSLEARDGQPQRDRHQPQPQSQTQPVIPARPLRRRGRAADGLRL